MITEQFRVESLEEAIELARAYAREKGLSEVSATAFATSWFDVHSDFDASTPDRLHEFLSWRFGMSRVPAGRTPVTHISQR